MFRHNLLVLNQYDRFNTSLFICFAKTSVLARSLMKMGKNNGPITEPCGTPVKISWFDDKLSPPLLVRYEPVFCNPSNTNNPVFQWVCYGQLYQKLFSSQQKPLQHIYYHLSLNILYNWYECIVCATIQQKPNHRL